MGAINNTISAHLPYKHRSPYQSVSRKLCQWRKPRITV